jgi:hypothetical protein
MAASRCQAVLISLQFIWLPPGAEAVVGALAQLGEHLLCKQRVIGSIPIGSTRNGAHRLTAGDPVGSAGSTRDGSVAQVVRAYA